MFVTDMTISLEEERRKPNKNDIRDCKTILKDFYIFVAIPSFKTIKELNEWRYKQIKIKLS